MLNKQFTKVNVIVAQNELFIRNLFIVISSVTPLLKRKRKKRYKTKKILLPSRIPSA